MAGKMKNSLVKASAGGIPPICGPVFVSTIYLVLAVWACINSHWVFSALLIALQLPVRSMLLYDSQSLRDFNYLLHRSLLGFLALACFFAFTTTCALVFLSDYFLYNAAVDEEA